MRRVRAAGTAQAAGRPAWPALLAFTTRRRATGAAKGRRPARKKPPPRWLRPATRIGAISLAALLVIGGPAYLVASGWVARQGVAAADAVLWATGLAGLTVGDVLVLGRAETSREEVLRVLAVERGMPILAFDPVAAKARLEMLPWVRVATVERRLPDTIFAAIEERRPAAIWQREGKFWLIDAEGAAITTERIDRFGKLPQIVGETANKHVGEILALLDAEPAIRARVEAARRVGDRRWDLRIDNGIDVRLPEDGAGDAVAKLAAYQREHRLLDRQVAVIDMRIADRMVLTLPEGGTESLPGPQAPGGSMAAPGAAPGAAPIGPPKRARGG